jgi:hypothetical protein
MTNSEILADFRNDLAQQIAHHDRPPALQPLPISPRVAMALMQKALRRGQVKFALRSCAWKGEAHSCQWEPDRPQPLCCSSLEGRRSAVHSRTSR